MNCEIEFLPVGDASKAGDAIVVRYGDVSNYELMIIDGGSLDSGKALVEHIRQQYGKQASIAHVVLTHPDADHASGLREVLTSLPVRNLWLHVPWLSSAAAKPYFADKRWTDEGLSSFIRKEYGLVDELVEIALAKKTVAIFQPFAGDRIGPFQVLSPHKNIYPLLLAQFDRTPEPDQEALEQAGIWIGKEPGAFARLFEKAVAKVQKWTKEYYDKELLRDGGVTSATNESSVVLYANCEGSGRVLLTGDAGTWGLHMAAYHAEQSGLVLQDFKFVQIPHHGSRRNVGPTILNRLLGPIQPESAPKRFSAYVSAPKDDDRHPRKMVLNAFIRRGGNVIATQGDYKVFRGGFPFRPNYSVVQGLSFATEVEEYD